ncbi:ABC-2 type transport system ATP-binding protein [Micromonospora sp. M71_S20]|uniref:ABC transporter ATP-binding protein n=1 Tax=Micromonospora sp. M71_S20 TaxID=592872 RepID=UPI000EAD2C36|nr:ABC transporter ATP-binding protein [Micromonospora sp. M71_S20]RLK12073.1 ABC-2 type transport system ATP-binding protein [Micromonospora sp. M71_S20]
MADPAIETGKLVKTYGRNRGLTGLDLRVERGEVYGFLGPNGAGKSTTIRLLLDLIRPTSGRVSVLGADPRRDGVALRRRIGYLAGDFVVDGRQSARELLTYLGNLRGGVPGARIDELAARLDLDLGRRIRGLSKGNRQKVGVVQAFMHEPELLILDEPTSGLDPFLQQEFLSMVREARADGRTVFMSSHVMSEVQQTADRVGIIREGRLVTVARVEELRERAVRRVEVTFAEPVVAAQFAALPGVSEVTVTGTTLRCRLDGRADALVKAVAGHTVVGLLSEEPDLEELFFGYYSREESARAAA